MASTLSNHFKYQLLKTIESDSLKLILMASGFIFDKDDHETLADVSTSELANGNGYTTGGVVLTNVAVSEDDTGDKGALTADNITFTASGGPIGPTPGAIIYDDSMSDDAVVGYIDFITERTVSDGNNLSIQNIALNLT